MAQIKERKEDKASELKGLDASPHMAMNMLMTRINRLWWWAIWKIGIIIMT